MATPATPPLLVLPIAPSTRPLAHPHTGSHEEDGHSLTARGCREHGGERGQDMAPNPAKAVLLWQMTRLLLAPSEGGSHGGR